MKLVKQVLCFFAATLMVFFFTNVGSAKAQMTKVYPDPVIAKADPKHINTVAVPNLAEPAIVTEDGPFKGDKLCARRFGILRYSLRCSTCG